MSEGKPFECGLVLGKFSPLHRGHELVIRRAFEMCREVVIISYSKPELPGCEAATREKWLAELFPNARRLVVTEEWLRERFSGGIGFGQFPANRKRAPPTIWESAPAQIRPSPSCRFPRR